MKNIWNTIKEYAYPVLGIGISMLLVIACVLSSCADMVTSVVDTHRERKRIAEERDYLQNASLCDELDDLKEFLERHESSCTDEDCNHGNALDGFYALKNYYESAQYYFDVLTED